MSSMSNSAKNSSIKHVLMLLLERLALAKDLGLIWASVRMSTSPNYLITSSILMKFTLKASIAICVQTSVSVLVLQLINGLKTMQIYPKISMIEIIEPRLATMAKSNLTDWIIQSKSHFSGHMIQLLKTLRVTWLNYRERLLLIA